MTRANVLIGAAAAAAAAVLATSPAMALPADFNAKADALLAASYAADGPGVSVAISEGGRIVYRGTRGLADVAAKRPVTPDTVFRIGSITKQFAAAVVLQLAAEGKLTLDDPLSLYLPTYPNAAHITVRELLNHTSGIQSYTGIPGWMVEANTNRAYTTEQLIAVFKDMPAPNRPGEVHRYNNSGYVLIGALIEKVTGHRWSDEVASRIARPLRLATLTDGVNEPAVAAMATGYTRGESGVRVANKIHMSVPGAAGALIADAADVARWGHALHHGKVVPAPYYAQMIAPTKLPDGTTVPYGFGIAPGTLRGFDTIGHDGGIFGFSSDSLYLPAKDLFVVALANSDRAQTAPGTLVRRLAALAAGTPYPTFTPQPVADAVATPMLGLYKFDGAERIFSRADGKYYTQRVGGPQLEAIPAGDNRFYYGDDSFDWFAMVKDAAGVWTMQRHPLGEDRIELGRRTGPVPAAVVVPAATLTSYVGVYSTPIGRATIAQGAGGLTIQLAGQSAFPMRATSLNAFSVDPVGATVAFTSDGGKVSGLTITQGGQTLPGTRD